MYDPRLKSPQTDLLARAFLSLRDEDECYRFMEDLFTVREIRDLSQRLEVAMLLKDKVTYNEIVERTGVSTATIGRVNRALAYGAGGYAAVIEKLSDKGED